MPNTPSIINKATVSSYINNVIEYTTIMMQDGIDIELKHYNESIPQLKQRYQAAMHENEEETEKFMKLSELLKLDEFTPDELSQIKSCINYELSYHQTILSTLESNYSTELVPLKKSQLNYHIEQQEMYCARLGVVNDLFLYIDSLDKTIPDGMQNYTEALTKIKHTLREEIIQKDDRIALLEEINHAQQQQMIMSNRKDEFGKRLLRLNSMKELLNQNKELPIVTIISTATRDELKQLQLCLEQHMASAQTDEKRFFVEPWLEAVNTPIESGDQLKNTIYVPILPSEQTYLQEIMDSLKDAEISKKIECKFIVSGSIIDKLDEKISSYSAKNKHKNAEYTEQIKQYYLEALREPLKEVTPAREAVYSRIKDMIIEWINGQSPQKPSKLLSKILTIYDNKQQYPSYLSFWSLSDNSPQSSPYKQQYQADKARSITPVSTDSTESTDNSLTNTPNTSPTKTDADHVDSFKH